jgi:hypothetical protein
MVSSPLWRYIGMWACKLRGPHMLQSVFPWLASVGPTDTLTQRRQGASIHRTGESFTVD